MSNASHAMPSPSCCQPLILHFAMTPTRVYYAAAFKCQVIAFVLETNSKTSATRLFNVLEANVRRWPK